MQEVIAILGRVIKGVGGSFLVDVDQQIVNCKSRKSVKYTSGNLAIGDYVEVTDLGNNTGVIEKIQKRRNSFLRPTVANIDKAVILISSIPRPDFYLIDKMLVNLAIMDIKVYIVVNKSDLDVMDLFKKVQFEYEKQVEKVMLMSTVTGQGIAEFEAEIEGGLSCLIGQSAVGKSSLINILKPTAKFEIGDVSKNNRGRHTTRHVEIVQMKNSTYMIDTPGFSFLEIDIDPKDLAIYYFDFGELMHKCKYTRCVHINEPDCEVLRAIEKGELSQDRYDRYNFLFDELMIKWRKKYG